MRDYGRVHTAFWTSGDVQAMSDDAKLLALYMLTSPHTTIIGAFRMPDGYVCEDLKWSSQRVSKGLRELFDKGFSNRCETTKWVWIRKFLSWNPPENPNQWKAARKIVEQIPASCVWKADFLGVFCKFTGSDPPPQVNPSETLSEPFRNQEQEQEQEQEQKKEIPPKPPGGGWGSCPDGVDSEAWAAWAGYKRGKPARSTITEMANLLRAQSPETQRQMVADSVRNGWKGCFAPKSPARPRPNVIGGTVWE